MPVTLLKKRLCHKCFPVNSVKLLKTPFFIEHLWTTASVGNRDHFNWSAPKQYLINYLIRNIDNLLRNAYPRMYLWFLFLRIVRMRKPLWASEAVRQRCSLKRCGCSSVNLLRIFRTPFRKNASDWLLLELQINSDKQCPSGYLQKQPSKGVLRKRWSENMLQI